LRRWQPQHILQQPLQRSIRAARPPVGFVLPPTGPKGKHSGAGRPGAGGVAMQKPPCSIRQSCACFITFIKYN
ncbi:MAG: hypothetical protein ACSW76_01625, partial [Bacteroidaceae bacterium]